MSDTALGAPLPDRHEVVIQAGRRWFDLGLRELWAYRELIWFFAWRNILVRYKQTILGPAWVVIQPVLFTITFYVVFRRIGRVDTPPGVSYALFAMTALIPWNIFQQGLLSVSESLTGNASLLSKVYFPRLAAPLSATLSFLLDFAVGLGVLGVTMALYGHAPTWRVLWVLPLTLLLFTSCLGVGIWLAALNVRYRDVRYAIRLLLQLMLFLSPIGYSSTELTGPLRTLYAVNPMAGIADGFRWAILGVETDPGSLIAIGSAATVLLLISGAVYFKRVERTFADVI